MEDKGSRAGLGGVPSEAAVRSLHYFLDLSLRKNGFLLRRNAGCAISFRTHFNREKNITFLGKTPEIGKNN